MQKIVHQGVTFYLLYRPSSPAIYAQLIVAGGSRDETAGTWGHTHLLEHLVSDDIIQSFSEHSWLESPIAESFEAEVGIEHTTYSLAMPKGEIHKLGNMLRTIFMFNSFDEKKLKKELKIVAKELDDHLVDPYMKHVQKFRAEIYGDSSPLARATAVGSEQSLVQVTVAQIYQLYNVMYQPKNITVYLVGDLESRDISKLDFGGGATEQLNTITLRTLPPARSGQVVSDITSELSVLSRGLVNAHGGGIAKVLTTMAAAELLGNFLLMQSRELDTISDASVDWYALSDHTLLVIDVEFAHCYENAATTWLDDTLATFCKTFSDHDLQYYQQTLTQALRARSYYPMSELDTMVWSSKCADRPIELTEEIGLVEQLSRAQTIARVRDMMAVSTKL